MAKELENVKVGDKLLITQRFSSTIDVVARVTQTLVITERNIRFKKNGQKLGETRYYSTQVRLATPEDEKMIYEQKRHVQLVSQIKDMSKRLYDLPNNKLEQILEILKQNK